jgi:hypothetical protein
LFDDGFDVLDEIELRLAPDDEELSAETEDRCA